MTDFSETLRKLAVYSIDGDLRGCALEAADHIEALEAENSRLREALSFYARTVWNYAQAACGYALSALIDDHGSKARAALNGEDTADD